MLSEKFNKGEEITLKDILDAVLKEDVLAIEILESVGHTLGKAIAGLINMFNPEMIVIGGLLSVAGESLMLPVRTAVNKYSLMLVYKDTQIKLSSLGERAGVMGACLLARSKSLGPVLTPLLALVRAPGNPLFPGACGVIRSGAAPAVPLCGGRGGAGRNQPLPEGAISVCELRGEGVRSLNYKWFCGACFFLLFSILVKKGQIVAVRRCLYYKLFIYLYR